MATPKKASAKMTVSSGVSVLTAHSVSGEITAEEANRIGILEWQLSSATVQEIEALESNIRVAQHESGKLLLG